MAKNPKSILKEPTIDLYEDVNVISGGKRCEKLFDDLFGFHKQNNYDKYDRNRDTRRAPLMTINANLSPKQQSLNSSDFNDENDITCIEVNEDFVPSNKTSRTRVKKNYNRVKFADNIDKRVNKVTKKKTKKDKDYPNCTKESLLKAFESANLPDYEEIARHELIITKVNGNDILRADPPTPPLYDILKPFEDLIDWSKVDMKSNESQRKVPTKESKPTKRKTTSSASYWETTENSNDLHEDNDVFDVDFVSNEIQSKSNKESTITSSDNLGNPSTVNLSDNKSEDKLNSKLFTKNERIRTAALGDSRIASTPVLRKLNVTLRSHNVSPIKSIDSPELVFNSTNSKVNNNTEDTFVAPLLPIKRKTRKVNKGSVVKENTRLDIVKPSLSDIEKVTIGESRAEKVSRSLNQTNLCDSCEELTAIDSESHTLINRNQSLKNKTSVTSTSVPFVASKDSSNSLQSFNKRTLNRNRTNELSSIFAPKIKSTPLFASKHNSKLINKDSQIHSKFDLYVDETHLDQSMSKLFPSKSYSHISLPIKTTTIVPVLDFENGKSMKLKRNTNAYHIYRKSIAAVHSIYNKSCHPFRTVVSNNSNKSEKFATGLNSKKDLQKCIDNSLSVLFSTSKLVFDDGIEEILTSRQKVLLHCDPNDIISFENVFETNILENCKKIGEGSYGEVYSSKDVCGKDFVIKIVPLNMINGNSDEDMFSQILPELVISTTFNHLKSDLLSNKAMNFIDMIKATCAEGLFPKKLIEEWDEFDRQKNSENDDPRLYSENQLYIIFQLSNGGTDLETYKFKNAIEAFSLFSQLALSLAAAESEYQFEHRDMHWGNVLISSTDQTNLEYIVNGLHFSLNTNGVFASIIDFSLSRMKRDGFIIYDDLAKYSDLFTGEGDYQFDIYRKMKEHNNNDWQQFNPKTNIFWLHYLLDKLLNYKKYSSRSKLHKTFINSLKQFYDNVLQFKSSVDFVNSSLFKQLFNQL